MKKLLFILGVLFMCYEGNAQCTFTFYLEFNNGQTTWDGTNNISLADITWEWKNEVTSCAVNGTTSQTCYVEYGVFMVDADDWNRCQPWSVGQNVSFSIEITNPAHPLYGAKASWTGAIPSNGMLDVHLELATEVIPTTLSINPVTICAGDGGILTVSVNNPPAGFPTGYSFDWGNGITTDGAITAASTTGKIPTTVTSTISNGIVKLMKTGETDPVATANYTVTVNPKPTVSIAGAGGRDYYCTGGESNKTLQLTASPAGATYKWTKGGTQVGTNVSYTPTAAGTYQVEVTDAKGCSNTATLDVKTYDPPTGVSINAGFPTDVCKGDGGKVELTASGNKGTHPAATAPTYTWSMGTANGNKTSISHSAISDAAGGSSVTVTADDGKCSAKSAAVSIQGHSISVTINPTGNQTVAAGTKQTVTATPTVKPTSAVDYVWTGTGDGILSGANANIIQTNGITQTSTYSVKVTDQTYGCEATSSTVTFNKQAGTELNVTAQGVNLCEGDANLTVTGTVSGGTAPYTYEWTGAGLTFTPATGSLASASNKPTVKVSGAPGAYKAILKITDKNGVPATADTDVKIYGKPALASVEVTTTDKVCFNDVITVEAKGGTAATPALDNSATLNYVWSSNVTPGATKNIGNAKLVAGDNRYTVKITDGNGCSSPERETTYVGHKVEVTAVKISPECEAGKVDFGTQATLSYTATFTPNVGTAEKWEWTSTPANLIDGSSTVEKPTTVALTKAGTFQVTVTDNFGCSGTGKLDYGLCGGKMEVLANDASGCAGSNMSLSCTVSGGPNTGTPTYVWTAKESALKFVDHRVQNPQIDPATPAGTYHATVEVTKGTSTETSAEVTITIKPNPTFTSATSSPVTGVDGGTETLRVNVDPWDAECKWTGGPITGNATGTSITAGVFAGGQTYTYKVTATSNECSTDTTIVVKVNNPTDPIVLVANDQEDCAGNTNFRLTASATGGAGTLSYQWEVLDGDLTLASYIVREPQVIGGTGVSHVKVTVSDGVKSEDKTITVRIKPQPVINSVAASLGGMVVTSASLGDVLDLSANYTPVGAECKWTSTGTPVLAPATGANVRSDALNTIGANTFTATVTNESCSVSQNVTVMVAAPDGAVLSLKVDKKCADSGQDLVLEMSATGGTTYSFTLHNNAGTVNAPFTGAGPWVYNVPLSQEGTYFVTDFKAYKNGVEVTPATVAPTSLPALFDPTPVITINGGTNAITACEREELTLSATSQTGGTYTWNNGVQNGQPFIPSVGGIYTVTAESEKGCKGTADVTVTLAPKPTVTVTGGDQTICLGDPVTLQADGTADVYTWNDGTVSKTLTVTPGVGGTLKYVVTGKENTNGCSDTAVVSVIVNEPPKIVAASKSTRKIAIGKGATFGVKATGKNLRFQWQRWEGNGWLDLYDSSSDMPTISGSKTDTLRLGLVPQSWNGTQLRCFVQNNCGTDDTTFVLNVTECFEIQLSVNMCQGIRPDTSATREVDGWFCPGTEIAICANLTTEEEDTEIENAHYKWYIDGLSADDHRGELTFLTDSSVLKWVPPVDQWVWDFVIKVCAYADGACDTVCFSYLRLRALPFDDVKFKLFTSVDPSRRFCPGDTVTCWVEDNGTAGKKPTYHWYNDIFDLSKEEPTYTDVVSLKNEEVVLAMGQEDTWVRVELTPSPEICVKEPILIDTAFLRKKQVVTPNFYIDCPDTLACKGDEVAMKAVWTNAGENPSFEWQRSIGVFPDWNLGNASTATVKLDEEDVWVKCTMKPSEEVCYSDSARLIDAIQIRVLKEDGLVTITSDMKDKHPGDELTFISEVSNIIGDIRYDWYVNNNLTPEHEENYISSTLKVGDVIQCAVSGERVCQNKVFSNELIVNYGINRDTMVTIWRDETIKNMDITQPGDSPTDVWFIIVEDAKHGWASLTPTGKFRYTPNPGYVGTDYIKYWVRDKFDNTKYEEGYIYITIRDNERFFIPNLITPNNDGLNDTWKLDFLADYPDHLVTVYDRNGRVVFEARDYQNDWDGTGVAKGGYVARINLMNGVYTYVIRLNDKDKTVLKSWVEIRADLNRKSYR